MAASNWTLFTLIILLSIAQASCSSDAPNATAITHTSIPTPISLNKIPTYVPQLATEDPVVGTATSQESENELATSIRETPTPTSGNIQISQSHEWALPGQNILDIKWSPDRDKILVVSSRQVLAYDVNTGQEIWHIPYSAPAEYASAAVFLPDGESFILYNRLLGLQVYETKSGKLQLEKRENNNPGNCTITDALNAIISTDGQEMYISISVEDQQQKSYTYSEIQVWDTEKLECISKLSNIEGHARSLSLSTDNKFIALSTGLNTSISHNNVNEIGQVVVRNLKIGQQACSIGHQGSIAQFKPDTHILLVADPKHERLAYWDVEKCDEIGEINGITTRYLMAFSPNGRLLAIWDENIKIVDTITGNILGTLDDPAPRDVFVLSRLIFSSLTFSTDGNFLLYSIRKEPSESLLFLWELERE